MGVERSVVTTPAVRRSHVRSRRDKGVRVQTGFRLHALHLPGRLRYQSIVSNVWPQCCCSARRCCWRCSSPCSRSTRHLTLQLRPSAPGPFSSPLHRSPVSDATVSAAAGGPCPREAKEVEACGGRACVVPVDVADADALDRAAETVERDLGPINVWVNNAMTSVFAEFVNVDPEEFRRVTDVTYHGYVNGTRSALRRMLPRDNGVIVQIGSALAYRGIPLQSAYCGAKHAIEGFTE